MVSVICSILPAPRLQLAALLLIIATLSTGCGLKGDLYLPEASSESSPQSSSEAQPQSDPTQDADDTDDDAARS